MTIVGYHFPAILRRSPRLQESGYYTEEGTPAISYKEILYRIFRRRAGYRYDNQDANFEADNMECNQDLNKTQAVEMWSPGTKNRRNRVGSFSAKNVSCFLFMLLLAFGSIHIYFQLLELQQEVQSHRRHMDMFLPLADTIPNYALESQGASVLQHFSSDTYSCSESVCLLWGRVCYWWRSSVTQRRVIQGYSSLHPGQCWCFSGQYGHLFISLSHPISITHVTLGHITKSQSPNGHITSASRNFSIYGMKSTDEEGTCLGTQVYDHDGPAFQTFRVSNQDDHIFRYVMLQIESNWGNIDHTCLYSFRVHGKLPPYLHY